MNIVYYVHDVASSEEFEQTVNFLWKRYRFISSEELRAFLNKSISLDGACLLTIDDGWLSTYQYIFPVIKKYGIPVLLFVSPEVCEGHLDYWFYRLRFCDEHAVKAMLINQKLYDSKIWGYPLDLLLKGLPADAVSNILSACQPENKLPRGFINTQELLEMRDSGWVEIGAHTLTHPILSLESDEKAEREILDSIRHLEKLVGAPVRSFAYPNGIPQLDFGEREMLLLEKTDVDLAFSVESNIVTQDTHPLAIPRVGSINRLRLGSLGVRLPSLTNQAGIRNHIAKHLL